MLEDQMSLRTRTVALSSLVAVGVLAACSSDRLDRSSAKDLVLSHADSLAAAKYGTSILGDNSVVFYQVPTQMHGTCNEVLQTLDPDQYSVGPYRLMQRLKVADFEEGRSQENVGWDAVRDTAVCRIKPLDGDTTWFRFDVERNRRFLIPLGRRLVSEVTGITRETPESSEASVQFKWEVVLSKFGQEVAQADPVRVRPEPAGTGVATLKLYDDGWRVQSLAFERTRVIPRF